MKKFAAISSSIVYLLSTTKAFAQDTVINIVPTGKAGYKTIQDFLQNLITVALTIGLILVVIMLVWGAFDWILSGGDKDAVGKARGRIVNALIGLAVMAVAFALARVGSSIAGLDVTSLTIPGPKQ